MSKQTDTQARQQQTTKTTLQRTREQVQQVISSGVLIGVVVIVLIVTDPFHFFNSSANPEETTTNEMVPAAELPNAKDQPASEMTAAANSFSTTSNQGRVTVTVQDIPILATEVIEQHRMISMFDGLTPKQTQETVTGWANNFNVAWQSGNQEETYLYGGKLQQAAAGGNFSAQQTVDSYLYGWEVTIKTTPVQEMDFTWLINAMHATASLGGNATDLFYGVVVDPNLKDNTDLYNQLVNAVGPEMENLREQVLGPEEQPAPENNNQPSEQPQQNNAPEPEPEPLPEPQLNPQPAESIAGTDFANTAPQEVTSNDSLVVPPMLGDQEVLSFQISPASYVIMAKDIWTWLHGEHTNANYELVSEHFATVTAFGKTYETPFVLTTIRETRNGKVKNYTFLLVYEINKPPLSQLFLDNNDNATTIADVSRKVLGFFDLDPFEN
ncbi:MAG: hypothetical protein ACOZAO_01385 [Patescibacteria group bacterium]